MLVAVVHFPYPAVIIGLLVFYLHDPIFLRSTTFTMFLMNFTHPIHTHTEYRAQDRRNSRYTC